MRFRFAQPFPTTPTGLFPSTFWNGTSGTGFNAGAPVTAAPTDPPRTTAKPIATVCTVPFQAFGSDIKLLVDADAGALAGNTPGVMAVIFTCEGNSVTVTSYVLNTRVDTNGNSKTVQTFACTLNWAATRTQYAGGGTVQVYYTIIANDLTMQHRVMGATVDTVANGGGIIPAKFYPRAPGVGAGCVNDVAINVGSGQTYTAIKDALNACVAGGYKRPLLTLTDSANYAISAATGFTTPTDIMWTTIVAGAAVNPVIGNGAVAGAPTWGWDGLCFRGSRVKIDFALVSNQLVGWRGQTNYAQWFDGCEIMQGTGSNPGQAGSGALCTYNGAVPQTFWNDTTTASTADPTNDAVTPLHYATDVYIHDIYKGFLNFQLVLNCIINDVVSSPNAGCFGFIGNTVNRPSAQPFRNPINALSLTYSGAAPYAGVITQTSSPSIGAAASTLGNAPNNGTGTMYFVTVEGASLGAALVTNVTPCGNLAGNYTPMATVATAISAFTGWSATLVSGQYNASYVSVSGVGGFTNVPSNGLCTASGSNATNVPVQVSGSITLKSVIDQHSDVMFYFGIPAWQVIQNRKISYNTVLGVLGPAHLDINQSGGLFYLDMMISNNIFQDTSNANGVLPGTSNAELACSHLVWKNNTSTGSWSSGAFYGGQNWGWSYGGFLSSKFTGFIDNGSGAAGGTLHVTAITSGAPAVGQRVTVSDPTGSGVWNLKITAQITTAGGDVSTWTVQIAAPAASGGTGQPVLSAASVLTTSATMLSSTLGGTYDPYCATHHNSLYLAGSSSGATVPTPNLNSHHNSYQTGSVLISGETGSVLQAAANDSGLYNSPSTTDYTPKSAGVLLLADSNYAGALLPTGAWNLVA